jgi:3-methyladenine DNA glycosylase AlkC
MPTQRPKPARGFSDADLARLRARKAPLRRSEVDPEAAAALNAGLLETKTLVEALVIDNEALLRRALPEAGFSPSETSDIVKARAAFAQAGVVRETAGVGAILRQALRGHPKEKTIFEALASRESDAIRGWLAYAAAGDDALAPKQALARARRFAADPHFGVREWIWMAVRPTLAARLAESIALLRPWTVDADENIRRFAVEVLRPRGVWCAHIPSLKADPAPGLPLLEPTRADASRYVRLSVANWLNDASKSAPEWTTRLCERWTRESTSEWTAWIVNHATRSLRKAAKEEGAGKETGAVRKK